MAKNNKMWIVVYWNQRIEFGDENQIKRAKHSWSLVANPKVIKEV